MSKEEGGYARYKVLTVNDEKDHCQCCGKTGLKRVVWIEDQLSGEIKHYGTICALHPSKAFGLEREVKAAVQRHQGIGKAITAMTHVEYRKAGGKYARVDEFSIRPSDKPLFETMRAKVIAAHPPRP